MTQAQTNKRFEAAIALGGNVGEVERTFKRATMRLDKHPGITLLRRSDWIQTKAVGGPVDQAAFLNGAIVVETTLAPAALLQVCQEVESHLGRDRGAEERWGPRTLDLDLLLYADQSVEQEGLKVPHARLLERRFVLEPLAQIAPNWQVPGTDASVSQWLERLPAECSL